MQHPLLEAIKSKIKIPQLIDLDKLPYGETVILNDVPEDLASEYFYVFNKIVQPKGPNQYALSYLDTKGWQRKICLCIYKINPVDIYKPLLKQYRPEAQGNQHLTLTIPASQTLTYNPDTYWSLVEDLFINHEVQLRDYVQSDDSIRVEIDLIKRSSTLPSVT